MSILEAGALIIMSRLKIWYLVSNASDQNFTYCDYIVVRIDRDSDVKRSS